MREGQLPFRLHDFLSGTYYALSVTVALVGLIAWTVHQQTRIDYLEEHEREHPTKQELSETAIRIDNRITTLELRILPETSRILEWVRRFDDMQNEINRISRDITVIIERQNVNTEAIKNLQMRAWSNGGERGPTAPNRP